LAQSAGAKLIDMDDVQVHPTGFLNEGKPDEKTKMLCAELLRAVGGIILDSKGNRFVNEVGTRDHVVGKMKATGEDRFRLVLTDQQAAQCPQHVPLYTKKGLLQRFNNATELASWMGVDDRHLRNTMATYSESDATTDHTGKQFFKNIPFAADAPFFAGTVVPVIHYTMGGIAVDRDGRVLRDAPGNAPVHGLWAAGEVAGGIHGRNRLGGNALTECVVFGRAVGNAIPLGNANTVNSTGTTTTTTTATTTTTTSEAAMAEAADRGTKLNICYKLKNSFTLLFVNVYFCFRFFCLVFIFYFRFPRTCKKWSSNHHCG
jgi:succinate dehydrogenase/fumarate reductase flavoprotein subunit